MKLLRYTIILAVVCTISTLGVAGTYKLTRARIQGREQQERVRAQGQVVPAPPDMPPEFTALNPDAGQLDQVITAKSPTGEILGYVAIGEGQGYGGKIRVMVGMNPQATEIIGLTIVPPLNETPGLGTRVAEISSNRTWFSMLARRTESGEAETTPQFLKQFLGLKAEEVMLGGDGKGIQAITGATVSSRGVVNAARNAVTKIQKAAKVTAPAAPAETESVTGATEWQQ